VVHANPRGIVPTLVITDNAVTTGNERPSRDEGARSIIASPRFSVFPRTGFP